MDRYYIYRYIYLYLYISVYMYFVYAAFSNRKRKTEAQVIVLHPFIVCSSCKRKLVVCLFVYEETNGSYPFANGLNVLNGVALYERERCICSRK
jgi:hypothetical protein